MEDRIQDIRETFRIKTFDSEEHLYFLKEDLQPMQTIMNCMTFKSEDTQEVLRLDYIRRDTMITVMEYSKQYQRMVKAGEKDQEISRWSLDFLRNIENEKLYDILNCSNFLDFSYLFESCLTTCARLLDESNDSPDVDKMKKLLGI